ncbi:MAG: carbon starvation protein A, partial [Candidatus Omnitrophica bacterium]|nr:carbon starvation protein A [Candidatus Omnitrophota bacterium]
LRKHVMPALPVMIITLCVFALAYRYYSAFLAAKVFALNAGAQTPAYTRRDGQNYYPMSKWVLFGHHFAAISGAGPLIGPVLAAQFGYLPGLLWIVLGVVLGGAVQDFIILVASTRRGARSLVEIVREDVGRPAGLAAAIAVLFIVIVALAGLGFVVVNALAESSWGTFTIAASIPIALAMGIYIFGMNQGASGAVKTGSIVGVTLLLLAVLLGKFIPEIPWLHELFLLDRKGIIIALAVYGFFASVLPVWLLLAPRDYLSSYMKLAVVFLLVAGVIIVNPKLHFPAVTEFIHGGGPIVPGKVWPFCFITIMCGAISGFHALVASGTTPKMLSNECHARPIGYGCMLLEGLVAVVCLVAASAMHPGDYYAINVSAAVYEGLQDSLGIAPVNLSMLTQQVGETTLAGRTGGAVSLAVGMAQIFSAIPGLAGLMKYWYHFAIMFEALFILTTIDAGTRIARFILQEFCGRFYAPFKNPGWLPGNLLASAAVVACWGFLIWNASIKTIWPMFGIANQLLAAIALAVGTVILVEMKKVKYVWVTLIPMAFVTVTTLTAAIQMVLYHYWPPNAPAWVIQINIALMAVITTCALIIFAGAILKITKPSAIPERGCSFSQPQHKMSSPEEQDGPLG